MKRESAAPEFGAEKPVFPLMALFVSFVIMCIISKYRFRCHLRFDIGR